MVSSTIVFSAGQNLGFLRHYHRHQELPETRHCRYSRCLLVLAEVLILSLPVERRCCIVLHRGCLFSVKEVDLAITADLQRLPVERHGVGSKGVGTCFQVLRQIWMKAFELLRRVEMGLIRTFLGFSGFGIGVSAGLVIGCYLFIYFQPTDVKDPIIRPLVERDSETLQSLLPEKPLWVNNPDFDRCVCRLLSI